MLQPISKLLSSTWSVTAAHRAYVWSGWLAVQILCFGTGPVNFAARKPTIPVILPEYEICVVEDLNFTLWFFDHLGFGLNSSVNSVPLSWWLCSKFVLTTWISIFKRVSTLLNPAPSLRKLFGQVRATAAIMTWTILKSLLSVTIWDLILKCPCICVSPPQTPISTPITTWLSNAAPKISSSNSLTPSCTRVTKSKFRRGLISLRECWLL